MKFKNYGKYKQIKDSLDQEYHGSYTLKRQMLHEKILNNFSYNAKKDKQSIIFTAGAMGAGKTHTIKYLHKKGFLNRHKYVTIDQDHIRSLLPEYNKTKPLEQHKLQKESGYLAEILLNYHLKEGNSIIFDTTLADYEWWKTEIERIKKICEVIIIFVYTDLDLIKDRVKKRALETGRDIPEETLMSVIEKSKCSFLKLKEIANRYFILENKNFPLFKSVEEIISF